MLLEALDRLQAVTSLDDLTELYEKWTELWNLDPQATPFQTPAWLSRWYQHLGGGDILVLICRRNDDLVGLLPLQCLEDSDHGRIEFLGAGISDHLESISLPGFQKETAIAFWEYLLAEDNHASQCVLRDIPSSSYLHQCAPAQVQKRSEEPCPSLEFGGASLRAVIPKKQFQKLSYYRNRAARLGITYETAEQTNFEELFSALVNLHSARWNARATAGVLFDQRVREFHPR